MRETWVWSLSWERLPTPDFWPGEFFSTHGVAKSRTRLTDFHFHQSLNVMISFQSHWQNLSFFKKLSATRKSEKYILVVWIYLHNSLFMNEFDHFFMFIICSSACVFLWIIHVLFLFFYRAFDPLPFHFKAFFVY